MPRVSKQSIVSKSRQRHFAVLVTATLAMFVAVASAQAQDDVPDDGALDEARAVFELGTAAYEEGRFEAALRHFQRSYELTESPDILFNVGTVADRLREDELALDAYERYLQARPDAEDREHIEGRIRILRGGVEVSDDPDPTNEPSPIVAAAQPNTPEDADEGGRLWTWIAGGTAIALGAATAFLWVDANNTYSEWEDRCAATGCTRQELDDSGGPFSQTLGNVFFGLSLAALGTAVVLFFVEGPSGEPTSAAVALEVGPSRVQFRGRF